MHRLHYLNEDILPGNHIHPGNAICYDLGKSVKPRFLKRASDPDYHLKLSKAYLHFPLLTTDDIKLDPSEPSLRCTDSPSMTINALLGSLIVSTVSRGI
jgi:hypothetical protein